MGLVFIEVWLPFDEAAPSIRYMRTYKGKTATAHNRFTQYALRKWPHLVRVVIEEA